jgi:site-specific DNA-cytosine methylase
MDDFKIACHSRDSSKFTCAVLCSGGLICTQAAVRSGFQVIWGTEICPQHPDYGGKCNCGSNDQQRMWTDWTGTPCLGNTFTEPQKYNAAETPDYLTSGFPCPNYSRSGNHTGGEGSTGWMFVQQAAIILQIKPKTIRLEMSDYALEVNNGREVKDVISQLSILYFLYADILQVWQYGDISNRARLFIVGTLRSETADPDMRDIVFDFPTPNTTEHSAGTYREIAVPDSDVADEYWLTDDPPRVAWKQPQGGKMHVIARRGEGMGHSDKPNAVQSMDGLPNTQTTLNGGGTRPRLDWEMHSNNSVGNTRKGVPIEAVRISSTSDSYLQVAEQYNSAKDPKFVFKCVNNGIPQRTCSAVDSAVLLFLRKVRCRKLEKHLKVQSQFSDAAVTHALHVFAHSFKQVTACAVEATWKHHVNKWQALASHTLDTISGDDADWAYAHSAMNSQWQSLCGTIRSAMLDTGANVSLFGKDVESHMTSCCKSRLQIEVANSQLMNGRSDGTLHMCILDSNHSNRDGAVFQHQITTVDNLSRELFSIDDLYLEHGFNVLLRQPDFESGKSELYRAATDNQAELSLPLRYDHESGGFWLDYTLSAGIDKSDSHKQLLSAFQADKHAQSIRAAAGEPEFGAEEATAFIVGAYANPAVTEVVCGQHEESVHTNIRGVKSGLRTKKQKLNIRDFHGDHGHLGCVGPCEICSLASGCARRIYHSVDRHTETRRAWRFDMDILTWQHRAEDGSKYQVVIRERSSGCYWSLFLYLRSDAIGEIRKWISSLRADAAFQNMEYNAVQRLHTDNAGEWGWSNAEFKELEAELGFKAVYSCPDRKEEAHYAERSVGIMEVTVKAMLLERDLPHSWWRYCAESAVFLLNRFPILSQLSTMPADGDQARPLELVTAGAYSRRQIDRELSYFVAVGTPVLVHDPKVKGSQLQPKASWWVVRGMYREQLILWSPFTHAIRKSKSYTAFKLVRGLSYQRFLSLNEAPATKRQKQIPADFNEKLVIKMQRLPESLREKVQQISYGTAPIVTVQQSVHNLKSEESGGSVTVIDELGQQMTLDKTNGELYDAEGDVCDSEATADFKQAFGDWQTGGISNSFVDVRTNPAMQKMWDTADAKAAEHLSIVSKCGDRFMKICKSLKIPFDLHKRYRDWIVLTCTKVDGTTIHDKDIPFGAGARGHCVTPNIRFPKPTGSEWRKLVASKHKSDRSESAEIRRLETLAVQQVLQEITEQKANTRSTGKVSFAKKGNLMAEEPMMRAMIAKAKRRKAVAAGDIAEPNSTREALERDHEKWIPSIVEEIQPLFDKGVLCQGPEDKGYTKADLLKEGIDITVRPAVYVGLYHTHKHNDTYGTIDRHKTRCAVKGHKGNMQKGTHFTETFAATPREDTGRILTALFVLCNLINRTGDVEKAYCWADVPPGELIAIRYPPGLKRYHPDTKEELYCILRKNLYGHPAAANAWATHRDSEILRLFNTDQWSCHQAEMDPCLFHFVRKGKKHGRKVTENMRLILDDPEISQAWVCIHTDDLDACGTDDEILECIFKTLDDRWKIKATAPDFMLGIKRNVTRDSEGNVVTCEHNMEAYVTGVAETFREMLPKKTLATIFPAKVYLSKHDRPSDEEIKANLGRGYMRAVGMILWAVRHCYPEGKYGVSQLCKMMSCPSNAAFEAAMHMIRYMEQHKNKGILFSANGNVYPVIMSDASNKPDPFSGLAHAGHTAHWANGPVSCKSSLLKHEGLSSEHNEYMGLTAALRFAVWMRQLLGEIGCGKVIKEPFSVYGDNIQANNLCKNHFVSTGNQHIFMPYHWNRRAVKEGHAIVKWVQTKFNISDIMTKPLDGNTFQHFLSILCGYEDIAEHLAMLEASTRIHTDK